MGSLKLQVSFCKRATNYRARPRKGRYGILCDIYQTEPQVYFARHFWWKFQKLMTITILCGKFNIEGEFECLKIELEIQGGEDALSLQVIFCKRAL